MEAFPIYMSPVLSSLPEALAVESGLDKSLVNWDRSLEESLSMTPLIIVLVAKARHKLSSNA
jgi:hypothetical protein